MSQTLNQSPEIQQIPKLRHQPTVGTVIRIPLSNGSFVYGLVVNDTHVWLYDFLTSMPAKGDAFFGIDQLHHALCLGDLPTTFVNCGKVSADKTILVPEPMWYEFLREDELELYGFKSKLVTYGGRGIMDAREITQEDIIRDGLHLHTWLEWHNYESLMAHWRSEMIQREVPLEFIDHEALRKMAAGEPVEEKPLPQPRKVEFVIVFQDADRSDDPEQDYEEPLEDALEATGSGQWAGSGTAPGVFEINVETISSDRARCLAVIRRVLKKAKAPASTVINELCEPPIDHPLENPPPATKKKPTSKKCQ